MNKMLAILLACLFVLSLNTAFAAREKTFSIVCTAFPQYDWVRRILDDRADFVDLTLLIDNGVDLHSYQPTAEDIIRIARSDLFIYVGGESDGWVDDVLAAARNPRLKSIKMLECVERKEEVVVEGMQAEAHDSDSAPDTASTAAAESDAHTAEHAHAEEIEYDAHVWLSLRNAEMFVRIFAEALGKSDPGNAALYRQNAEQYIAQLNELDSRYADVVRNGLHTTVLFADRFPFRYLTDDYGLTYYAAFVGCSAETEADFETIAFLAGKVDELNLPAVLTIEGGNRAIAETVVANAHAPNRQILEMNSLQSVTAEDIENGESYLHIMTENLHVLEKALN